MSDHSVLPPSGASSWVKCTAWVKMNERFPELEESESSREGSAAHEIAAKMINSARTGNNDHNASLYVGSVAKNGVVITEEMFDSAKVYADSVAFEMTRTNVFGGEFLGIEHRIDIPTVHKKQFGTVDCFLFDEIRNELIIWDFKHGYLKVEAFENYQLINYAVGLLDILGINGQQDQETIVRMMVVQPRCYGAEPVREWSVIASELRGYVNTLKMQGDIALSDQATCTTGPQCTYCPGRHACEPALQQGLSLYEITSKNLPDDANVGVMGLQLRLIKRALKQLGAIESGISEQLEYRIRHGEAVPFWKLGMKSSKRAWNMTDKQVIDTGVLMGVDLAKTTVITPTQAKKAGMNEETVNALSKNIGKLSLIEDG